MKKWCCREKGRRLAGQSYPPAFVDQLDKGETCILLDGVLPFLQVKTHEVHDCTETTSHSLITQNYKLGIKAVTFAHLVQNLLIFEIRWTVFMIR